MNKNTYSLNFGAFPGGLQFNCTHWSGSRKTTGNDTHLEVVWVGLGRIGFGAGVDCCCVEVEVLVEVLVVADVLAFGSGVAVVLVGG